MRGLYRRGSIYWISYQAGVQTVRESTGTGDRKLAEGVLAKRRAEVFEGRWKGRIRDVKTPLHQAAQEYLDLYARPHKISWREDERILRRFESEVGSDLPIQQIDRRTVEQFLLKLLAAGLSKGESQPLYRVAEMFLQPLSRLGQASCESLSQHPPLPGNIADTLAGSRGRSRRS